MAEQPLLARLRQGPLLADGAMGTMLYGLGIGYERCFDALCETRPELVRDLHQRYVAAGARLIETNTFGANAFRLAEHGLEDRVRAINLAGAQLARAVADAAALEERVWVAGSIGPLGAALAPLGPLDPEAARAAYAAQAAALAEGGVDLIVIETMRYLREAQLALEAVRSACDLPVAVLMTFGEDGRTASGRRPAEVAAALDALGADLLGANCSTGPAQMLEVMARMASATSRPLVAMPNAGLPAVAGGRYVYTASPAYMAELARDMVAAGLGLIGGCCGTTPEHIAAMREALASDGEAPPPLRLPGGLVADGGDAPVAGGSAPTLRGPTDFERALHRGPAVCVSVDPPSGFDAGGLLEALRPLAESAAVDAFVLSDSPRARPRASALATGALIRGALGAPTLLHVACRHRNLVAIHADLMGAHALGLRDLVVVMGELPAQGDYPNATVVNDVSDVQLIRLLDGFNQGYDQAGRPLAEPTAFHIGCRLHFGALDLGREIEAFERKVAAGARFAISDPLYDPSLLEAALERLGGAFPVPLLVGLLPLESARHAAYLHNEVPGIDIPPELLARLRAAGEQGREAGLSAAAELIAAVRSKVAGIQVLPPFERYGLVTELVGRALPERALPQRASAEPQRLDASPEDAPARRLAP